MTAPLWIALAVFAVAYILIVTEWVDRTAVAILAATACVLLGLIPYEEAIETVDLDVIFLLTGMMLVVAVLADTGLFEWVAIAIAKASRGNGLLILMALLVATAVLSAILDNVTTVVLIAPIAILITQILALKPAPFLILLVLFSNIGGAATLVGDPPNILIGSASGLTFRQFGEHLGPIVLVIMVVTLPPLAFFMRTRMHAEPAMRQRILRAHPRLAITDPGRLKRGAAVFALIMGGFLFSHAIGVQPGLIALAGGLLMLVVCRSPVRETLERVEWTTIFFLVGLFMTVGALEHNGLFDLLGEVLLEQTEGQLFVACMAILWIGAALSALAGNIPVVIALIPLVQVLIRAFHTSAGLGDLPIDPGGAIAQPLWWSLALGTCLGGNGSLFGAAANIVVAQIARRNGYQLSFVDFLRYGLPLTLGSCLLASVYIYGRYFYFG